MFIGDTLHADQHREHRMFVRGEVSTADRIRARELGRFLRTVGDGNDQRLRLGTGPGGGELFPTGEEAERAARIAAEAAADTERTAKEAERATKEAALAAGHSAPAARDAALARVAELEEKLRRRTTKRPRHS